MPSAEDVPDIPEAPGKKPCNPTFTPTDDDELWLKPAEKIRVWNVTQKERKNE